MTSLHDKVSELLRDATIETQSPTEKWWKRSWFDPMHGLTEISYSQKNGWIETRWSENERGYTELEFRLTEKGLKKIQRSA